MSSTWKDDVLTTERKGPKSHSSYTDAPRIEVVRFVSIRNSSFRLCSLKLFLMWIRPHVARLPTGSLTDLVTHQPRPFPFSDHQAISLFVFHLPWIKKQDRRIKKIGLNLLESTLHSQWRASFYSLSSSSSENGLAEWAVRWTCWYTTLQSSSFFPFSGNEHTFN